MRWGLGVGLGGDDRGGDDARAVHEDEGGRGLAGEGEVDARGEAVAEKLERVAPRGVEGEDGEDGVADEPGLIARGGADEVLVWKRVREWREVGEIPGKALPAH